MKIHDLFIRDVSSRVDVRIDVSNALGNLDKFISTPALYDVEWDTTAQKLRWFPTNRALKIVDCVFVELDRSHVPIAPHRFEI